MTTTPTVLSTVCSGYSVTARGPNTRCAAVLVQ